MVKRKLIFDYFFLVILVITFCKSLSLHWCPSIRSNFRIILFSTKKSIFTKKNPAKILIYQKFSNLFLRDGILLRPFFGSCPNRHTANISENIGHMTCRKKSQSIVTPQPPSILGSIFLHFLLNQKIAYFEKKSIGYEAWKKTHIFFNVY